MTNCMVIVLDVEQITICMCLMDASRDAMHVAMIDGGKEQLPMCATQTSGGVPYPYESATKLQNI